VDMSNYEFWDELGKIFSAVVAYQEKNIEFNKRFIVPWIRLGNVFDKQDRNDAAVSAYQQAIDIDPTNAQHWLELGNAHFKMRNHQDAIHAFNKAIQLDPTLGRAYNNLALTLVGAGEHEQAIPLYQKSIGLLNDAKDKAVAWNRLGNVYRKLNRYEEALDAFHQADELDMENAGFRDDLDEESEGPAFVQSKPEGRNGGSAKLNFSPIELIVAQSRAEEAAAQSAGTSPQASPRMRPQAAPEPAPAAVDMAVPEEIPPAPSQTQRSAPAGTEASNVEATVTAVVPDAVETFTDSVQAPDASSDTTEPPTPAEEETAEDLPMVEPAMNPPADEPIDPDAAPVTDDGADVELSLEEAGLTIDPQESAVGEIESGDEPDEEPDHNAYEEFLKDTDEPIHDYAPQPAEESEEAPASEPAHAIDPKTGEVQIEMDTKNAHVWNELGNVYYNSGAYDDAIVAYSKAIELDRFFAWPYSNLALAYVQKRRFVEAILLYQRSIELFTSDKDKAVSWNRLGNVYRRLNDYENSIAAYQRADSLDPDNATLSLQSRFSLLGNYATAQKPGYVS